MGPVGQPERAVDMYLAALVEPDHTAEPGLADDVFDPATEMIHRLKVAV